MSASMLRLTVLPALSRPRIARVICLEIERNNKRWHYGISLIVEYYELARAFLVHTVTHD